MDINYIIDKKGKQSAVIVPINQWEKFMNRFSQLKKKIEILTGITEGVDEVNEIKKGKKKAKLFKDFLDEN